MRSTCPEDSFLFAPVWRRLVLRTFYRVALHGWKVLMKTVEDPDGRQLRRMERERAKQEAVLMELTRREEELRMARSREGPAEEEGSEMLLAVVAGKGEYLKPWLPPSSTCKHEEIHAGTNAFKSYSMCRNPLCKMKREMPKVKTEDFDKYVADSLKKNPAARSFYQDKIKKGRNLASSSGSTSSRFRGNPVAAAVSAIGAAAAAGKSAPTSSAASQSAASWHWEARRRRGREDDEMSVTTDVPPPTADEAAARRAAEATVPRDVSEVAVTCQRCQRKMVLRRNRFTQEVFWGCPNYPAHLGRCPYTLPFETQPGQEPVFGAPLPTSIPAARGPPQAETGVPAGWKGPMGTARPTKPRSSAVSSDASWVQTPVEKYHMGTEAGSDSDGAFSNI